MSNNEETNPVIDVQNLVQDIQNTVWGILESHGIDVPNKEKWTAMYNNIPAKTRKKKEEKKEDQ